MQKNVAGKWIVFAFQDEGGSNPGDAVTGDAANITANIRIDGGAANAVDDTNPTELENGYYVFDITATESNGDLLLLAPASSTANVQVIGVPGAAWTTPPNFSALGIESDGDVTQVNTCVANTDMRGTDSAALASVATEARLSELDAGTGGKMANQVDIIQTDTTTDIPALIAALNDPTAAAIATAVLTTQMTESYAANGTAPTLAQAQFAIHQMLMQFGISGTSLTVRQLDDTTTAFVVTLDSASAPTDASRT